MSTKYFKDANTFFPVDQDALDVHEVLPGGNYILKFNKMREAFYFECVDRFELPGKLYGDTFKKAKKILNTFEERSSSTGLLLTGEKGSGKTLLGKVISDLGSIKGYPTIIVNTDFTGDTFNKCIQDINQPCIIMFDEFEKVYNREKQEEILTLLDGVFPTKKLFIFTCNDKYRVNEHMTNRPGRIYYTLEYGGLECDFIRDYCNDNLKEIKHIDTICNIGSTFDAFNFDILKAIVEEMNRYNESPYEALEMLNASPTKDRGGEYDIVFALNGVTCKVTYPYNAILKNNPVSMPNLNFEYENPDKGSDNSDIEIIFKQDMLSKVEPLIGRFTYDNGAGGVVSFTRINESKFSYSHFASLHAF